MFGIRICFGGNLCERLGNSRSIHIENLRLERDICKLKLKYEELLEEHSCLNKSLDIFSERFADVHRCFPDGINVCDYCDNTHEQEIDWLRCGSCKDNNIKGEFKLKTKS